MTRPGQIWPPKHRPRLGCFSVAFSFAGEQTDLVRQMAQAVEEALLPGEVFFDENLEHEIQGLNSRVYLTKTYLYHSVLVVRCLSKSYKRKIWPQFESAATDLRDNLSVLDVQMTKDNVNGLAGARAFCPRADLNIQSTIQAILTKVRALHDTPTLNAGELRNRINPFHLKLLIQELAEVTIEPAKLYAAIHSSGMKMPSDPRPEYDTLAWWLNDSRAFEKNTQLIALLHGVWPGIKHKQAFLQQWFQKYTKDTFTPPTQELVRSSVLRVRRSRCRGIKSEQRERLMFEIPHSTHTPDFIEGPPETLQLEFTQHFDRIKKHGAPLERIEFAVEADFLTSRMQRWQIDYQGELRDIRLVYPTTFRILERDREYSSDPHWQRVKECEVAVHHCTPPFKLGWERNLCQHIVVSLNRIEQCVVESGFRLRHLVASRLSIAFWFEGDCRRVPKLFSDPAAGPRCIGLPLHFVDLRYQLSARDPDLDIVLLFEDADIPIDQPAEMDLP